MKLALLSALLLLLCGSTVAMAQAQALGQVQAEDELDEEYFQQYKRTYMEAARRAVILEPDAKDADSSVLDVMNRLDGVLEEWGEPLFYDPQKPLLLAWMARRFMNRADAGKSTPEVQAGIGEDLALVDPGTQSRLSLLQDLYRKTDGAGAGAEAEPVRHGYAGSIAAVREKYPQAMQPGTWLYSEVLACQMYLELINHPVAFDSNRPMIVTEHVLARRTAGDPPYTQILEARRRQYADAYGITVEPLAEQQAQVTAPDSRVVARVRSKVRSGKIRGYSGSQNEPSTSATPGAPLTHAEQAERERRKAETLRAMQRAEARASRDFEVWRLGNAIRFEAWKRQ